jgi:hypothetical protein
MSPTEEYELRFCCVALFNVDILLNSFDATLQKKQVCKNSWLCNKMRKRKYSYKLRTDNAAAKKGEQYFTKKLYNRDRIIQLRYAT